MKECGNIISFYYKESSMHTFFYPYINYQGYQQAPSNKCSLPTQDRTQDFTVSSQLLNSLLEIAKKVTVLLGTYQLAT